MNHIVRRTSDPPGFGWRTSKVTAEACLPKSECPPYVRPITAERDCRSRHNRRHNRKLVHPMKQLKNNRFVVWSIEEDRDKPAFFIDGKFARPNPEKGSFHKGLDGPALGGPIAIFHRFPSPEATLSPRNALVLNRMLLGSLAPRPSARPRRSARWRDGTRPAYLKLIC